MTTVDIMSEDEWTRLSTDESRGFGSIATESGNLPMTAMQVRACITGLSTKVTLAQTFVNTLEEPLEVTYVFPLPPRGAVSEFRVEIAGRTIVGCLKERGKARREYSEAIAAGYQAAIAEEDRSGVFSMRLGNLLPGEEAVVHLELVAPLAIEDGHPCFRFPLVVAPRYMPGTALDGRPVGDGVAVDTDAVPDASRISPPVLLKGCKSPIALSMSVVIETGDGGVTDIRSSLHSVLTRESPDTTTISLQPGERLDRDFILRFSLSGKGIITQLNLCADAEPQEDGNEGSLALTLVPPTAEIENRPRDLVFVLDRSGSMSGWKMVAARRAVGRMLDSLGSKDRFTVLAFDHEIVTPDLVAGQALHAASDRNRYRSLEWLAKIDARGGTEMMAPLVQSLSLLQSDDTEREAMLVLITDGQVGNEDQIVKAVAKQLREIRVFTIGIDRAVNEGFLQKMAVLGGGACALVESEDRLDEMMAHVHRRISTPVLTSISIRGEGISLDEERVVPRKMPDLLEGCPIVLRARYKGKASGAIVISGTTSIGDRWETRIAAVETRSSSLHRLWARGYLRDLEDRFAIGNEDLGSLESKIVATSLQFHVLCRFTSFVAVDKSLVVNKGGENAQVVQPVELPSGWDSMEFLEEAPASPQTQFGGAVGHPAAMPPSACAAPAPASASSFFAASPRSAKKREKPSQLRRFLMSPPEVEVGEERKEELALPVEEEATGIELSGYQRRLQTILSRALEAKSERTQVRILLQSLASLLGDLATVGASIEFVQALEKAHRELRELWDAGNGFGALGAIVKRLQALSTEEMPPAPATRKEENGRTSFWK